MPQQMDITRYKSAIDLVKKMCSKPIGSEIPIKVTHFVKDHKLNGSFFKVLESLNIIKTEVSAHKEGTIFSWIHKPASNEPDTFLATRVSGALYEINHTFWKNYNSPEAKKKRAKQEFKESTKRKTLTQSPIIQPSTIIQAEPELLMVDTHSTESQQPDTTDTHSTIKFNITGKLTKKAILAQLEVLLQEQTITSFSIEATY